MNDKKGLHMFINAHGETKEEAFDNFKKELKHVHSFLRGYVYWHENPRVMDEITDEEEELFLHHAVIVAFHTENPGMEIVNPDGPYPESKMPENVYFF